MAVAFDNATQNSGTGTRTFNHTITGSDVGLVVFVCSGDELPTVTGITYDGVALSFIRQQDDPPNLDAQTEVWQLAAPATGTNQVVVTISGAPELITAIAMSFTGTNQTTLVANHNGNAGLGGTASVTVDSAANRMVADAISIERDQVPATVGADQTQRTSTAENRPRAKTSTEPGAAPNVVMSWNSISVGRSWTQVAVDIDVAAGARRVMVIS